MIKDSEIIRLWQKVPGVGVDFYRLVKALALSDEDERPVTFTVKNDATSETRLCFAIDFPASDGQMHTVTADRYDELLWMAAGIEFKAWASSKINTEQYDEWPLPLFQK